MRKKYILVILILITFTSYSQTNIFPASGNVGIGTLNPKALLSLGGNGILNLDWTYEKDWGGNSNKWSGYIGFNAYRSNNQSKDYFERVNNYTMRMIFEGSNYGFRWLGEDHVPNRGASTEPKKLSLLMRLSNTGNLSLFGRLEAKEIKVTTSPTADFVFEKNYNLPELEFIENYIKENKHLPEIPSAVEMEEEGVNVGEFQIKLLQKIEELTLYTIQQEKRIEKLEQKNQKLMEAVELLLKKQKR